MSNENNDSGKRKLSENVVAASLELSDPNKVVAASLGLSDPNKIIATLGLLDPNKTIAALGLLRVPNKEDEIIKAKEISKNMEDSKTINILREDPQIKANRELKEDHRKILEEFKKDLIMEIQEMFKKFKEDLIIEIQEMFKNFKKD